MSPAVLVFDGECGLCNRFVAFLVRRDSRGNVKIAASQSDAGAAVARRAGLDPRVFDETAVLWHRGVAHLYSDAVAATLRLLPPPWRALTALRLAPRPVRNAVYGFIADRRPRVDVADPACGAPPPALVRQWRAKLAGVADVDRAGRPAERTPTS